MHINKKQNVTYSNLRGSTNPLKFIWEPKVRNFGPIGVARRKGNPINFKFHVHINHFYFIHFFNPGGLGIPSLWFLPLKYFPDLFPIFSLYRDLI